MPTLVSDDSPSAQLIARATLRAGDQVCPLDPGAYALGGGAPDAVPLSPLVAQPRAAMLTVSTDGAAVLQRTTASVVVRVDGEVIGVAPVELLHGARIELGECRLLYECEAPDRAAPSSRTAEGSISTAATGAPIPAHCPSGRFSAGIAMYPRGEGRTEPAVDAVLIDVRSGMRHPLPARRVYIGRDESCDIVVRGNNVSRRHASIAPVAGGFMLRDESANGTQVNGVRVVGTYLLGNGDAVRIQDVELRVELAGSGPPPLVSGDKTTLLDLSHITAGLSEEDARATANRAVVASLEIVRGSFAGACFQVERAVCSIGRSEENDVRIRDDTVSVAHATLLRKRGAWFVVDLRSLNGTFVDGSRVSGEREIHPGARLRVGSVELVFRTIDSDTHAEDAPRRSGLWARLMHSLRRATETITPPR